MIPPEDRTPSRDIDVEPTEDTDVEPTENTAHKNFDPSGRV
jgi:hypothetical protein